MCLSVIVRVFELSHMSIAHALQLMKMFTSICKYADRQKHSRNSTSTHILAHFHLHTPALLHMPSSCDADEYRV